MAVVFSALISGPVGRKSESRWYGCGVTPTPRESPRTPAPAAAAARGREHRCGAARSRTCAGKMPVSPRTPAPPRVPLPRPFSPEGPEPYSPRSSQRPRRGRPSRLRAMARLRAGSPASTEPAAAPGAGAGAEGSGGARLALPTAAPRWGGGGGQVAGTGRGGTCRPDARDEATPQRAARAARSDLGVAGTLPGGRALGLRVVGLGRVCAATAAGVASEMFA